MIAAELAIDTYMSLSDGRDFSPADALGVLKGDVKAVSPDGRTFRPRPGAVASLLLGAEESGRRPGSFMDRFFISSDENPYVTQGEACCGALALSRELLASDVSDTVCRMAMEGYAKRLPPHVDPSAVMGAGAAAAWLDLEGWWNLPEVREGLEALWPPEYLDEARENLDALCKARSWEEAVTVAMSLSHLDASWPCLIGGLAETIYGVPREVQDMSRRSLDQVRLRRLDAFEERLDRAVTLRSMRAAACRSELESPVLYCEVERRGLEVNDEWDYRHVQSLPFGREMLDRAEFAHTWNPDLSKVYDVPPLSRDMRLLAENEGYAVCIDWSGGEAVLYQKMTVQVIEDIIRYRGGLSDPATELSHDLKRAFAGLDLSTQGVERSGGVSAEELLESKRLEQQRLCLWVSAGAMASAIESQGVVVSLSEYSALQQQRREKTLTEMKRQVHKARAGQGRQKTNDGTRVPRNGRRR